MIKIDNVDKIFQIKKQNIYALKHVNVDIPHPNIVGIIGHSGAGKSTLLRLINGLEQPTQGTVEVLDLPVHLNQAQALKTLRKNVAMIFQHFNLLKSKTVFENIAFPLRLNHLKESVIQQRVEKLASQVGLSSHLNSFPKHLSGGQKQRVGIARALATEPKILLCDEVTSALDPMTTHEILNLLLTINQEQGIGIVLITHEIDVIRKICDHVIVMSEGQVVEQGTVDQVLLQPKHPVSRSLILEPITLDAIGSNTTSYIRITAIGDFAQHPKYESFALNTNIQFQMIHSKVERTKTSLYSQSILAIDGEVDHQRHFIEKLQQHQAYVEKITPTVSLDAA
ncbi:methionine ABC transporter ATP-binding protein MetN [Acinetobacter apis]|uniref:D-methionine transport system ATP-binding protein n=1 Tax=Acinetobacter apis TaxID=1229165 RepID=A0A217EIB0_9GAMM|nr:ATP-binding cassette domain-containing protein [Acinetobacter apis]SNQ30231.1 D-methionine transport system ATP-binding protein [Acinetobacter apis]